MYHHNNNSLPYVTDYYQQQKKPDENMESDLRNLLDDSNGVNVFSEFLELEEHAVHYLHFWFCCKGFKTAEECKIYDLIKGIYRTYIKSESKTAVALQPSTKKNIVDKISAKSVLDRNIFDEAQYEVWQVLVRDLYPRFMGSEHCKRYLSDKSAAAQNMADIPDPMCYHVNIKETDMPYVEYMTSNTAAAMLMHARGPQKDMGQVTGKSSRSQQASNSGGSSSNTSHPSQATGALVAPTVTVTNSSTANTNQTMVQTTNGSKDRRGIAETDPTGFCKQLTAKLEKLRLMQQCGRSILNAAQHQQQQQPHQLQQLQQQQLQQHCNPYQQAVIDDDPQTILDIHDSYVMRKEPQKLHQSSSSTSIKRDADLRSVVSQDSGVAAAGGCGSSSDWGYSPAPLGTTTSPVPALHQQQQLLYLQTVGSQAAPPRQVRHYRHHEYHHLRARRRNRSQDQSVCSLEEAPGHHHHQQQLSYVPRKNNKSQASDASSIFDSGVSSTYEQLSHSLHVTTDRVSHWIINQPPGPAAMATAVHTGGVTPSIRRSSSAQTPGAPEPPCSSNGAAVAAATANGGSEVWIDAPLTPPPLVVGYYLCGDPVPYRTQVAMSPGLFTLAQFKQLLPRRGPYRFFFKRPCDEFEGGGAVHEEIARDEVVLPLWDGKVVAKVEKVD